MSTEFALIHTDPWRRRKENYSIYHLTTEIVACGDVQIKRPCRANSKFGGNAHVTNLTNSVIENPEMAVKNNECQYMSGARIFHLVRFP